MRISIEPTSHDSIFTNGEDREGHKDWMEHPSASVEFRADDDWETVFARVHQLLLQMGWSESLIEGHMLAYIESREEPKEKQT